MKKLLIASILAFTSFHAGAVFADSSPSAELSTVDASSKSSSIIITQPRTSYVDFTAGTGTYAATANRVYAKVHSASGWSSWQSFVGINRGQTKTLTFTTYGLDSIVDDIMVWVGDDGARLTLDLESNGRFYDVAPTEKWVKSGSTTFSVSEAIYDGACCSSGEGESGSGCTPVNSPLFECAPGNFKLDCNGTDGTLCVDDICECCHDCA